MTIVKTSEARQRNLSTVHRTEREAIERASVFTVCTPLPIALNATGDVPLCVLPYDCEFLGGFLETSANEGTDGTLTVEKWDDVAGSAQTAISAEVAIDAGAAAIEAVAAVSDGEEVVAAGYKLNLLLAEVGEAITGKLTLFFKHVDDIGRSG